MTAKHYPPLTKALLLQMTEEQHFKLLALGGSKWLRDQLEAAPEPKPKSLVRITNVHKTELPNPRTNWWGGLT